MPLSREEAIKRINRCDIDGISPYGSVQYKVDKNKDDRTAIDKADIAALDQAASLASERCGGISTSSQY